LSKAALEIMDSRLGSSDAPILDLRPAVTAAAPPAPPLDSQDNSQ
jgi:hypothetical protein